MARPRRRIIKCSPPGSTRGDARPETALATRFKKSQHAAMHTPPAAGSCRSLLFSGHMIDALGRAQPRFPPQQEGTARQALAQLLQALDAGPQDRAVSSAACGGDILFAEAAAARGVPTEIYLPFPPEDFVGTSVAFAGGDWPARFAAVCAYSAVHVMPLECPPLADGEDAYAQTNLWMLEAASRYGSERVEFICLWDGQGGDGPGGTHHLSRVVAERQGRTHWLDTRQLFGLAP